MVGKVNNALTPFSGSINTHRIQHLIGTQEQFSEEETFPNCSTISGSAIMEETTATATISAPHVAVLAFPFGSHAPPLLAITRRLAISSPNTHFSFFSTQQSNSSIFNTYNKHISMPPNVKAYDVWDGVPEGCVSVRNHEEGAELFLKAAPESFKKGMEAAVAETGRKVSCLVTDAFFCFAADMAEEIEVAWLSFWAAAPSSLSAHVYTDYMREAIGVGDAAGREDEPLNLVPGMSKFRVADLPEGVLFGNLGSPFSHMLLNIGKTLPRSAAVIMNSFEELDPVIISDLKLKFKKLLNIGPFNLLSPPAPAPDIHGCITWLDKQRVASVAYVAFGSVATLPPEELVALAQGLEASKVPFLWSLGDKAKESLPDGFLERTKLRGITVPWAPQLDVLGHRAVGVFITHCGWNSLLESVAGGVPLICRPVFADHRLNGRMIQDVWGIGRRVEGGVFTKNGVINTLYQIIFQDNGEKMRENIRALKELAERAVGPEGSSTNNFITLLNSISKPAKY